MQFRRTDLNEDWEQTLTIMESEQQYYAHYLGKETPYLVQVTHGTDYYVGLFDLDGSALTPPPRSWWVAQTVPVDVIEAVEQGWATANHVIERLASPAHEGPEAPTRRRPC